MNVAATIKKNRGGKIERAVLAGGSIFPAPGRMPKIEKMLEGKKADLNLFKDAADLASELMIKESGYRWSTPYKKPALEGLLKRALLEAAGLEE